MTLNVQSEAACPIKHTPLIQIIEQARLENRTILDEVESKQVLEAYDIPCVPTRVAKSAEEAAQLAKDMGFPIVLKVYSRTITHKTDVGGVKLNLLNAEAVKKAYDEIYASVKKLAGIEHFQGVTVQPMIKLEGYELILGSTIDEQFGPILLFGSGGQLVEVYKDRSLAIPPLTTTLARRMREQTKIYTALHGVRGRKSIDLAKLEEILVQFSNLVVGQPWIKECDINPLLASPDKLIALDARVILHDSKTKEEDLPKLAIRPYPVQYVETCLLNDQTPVTIRPIRPEDEPIIVQFHKELSQETVRQRFLKTVNYDDRVAHDRMIRICFNDYDREIALILARDQEGNLIEGGQKKLLFWVYYQEARRILANTEVGNRFNTAQRMSFEDIFQKRMFNSYIIKEDNIYNRRVDDYKVNPLDALLESERIKQEMINFEIDLWEY